MMRRMTVKVLVTINVALTFILLLLDVGFHVF